MVPDNVRQGLGTLSDTLTGVWFLMTGELRIVARRQLRTRKFFIVVLEMKRLKMMVRFVAFIQTSEGFPDVYGSKWSFQPDTKNKCHRFRFTTHHHVTEIYSHVV